jgi:PD-(D/E)XK nuclease superfamily
MLHLSKSFRNGSFPLGHITDPASVYLDYSGFLGYLESYFGLKGYSENSEYLRVELYRQAMKAHLDTMPKVFYAASYKTDRFATASACLQHRDSLLMAGFDFSTSKYASEPRLTAFCAVETLFQPKITAKMQHRQAFGAADRWAQVLAYLEANSKGAMCEVMVYDEMENMPKAVQKTLNALQKTGNTVHINPPNPTQYAAEGTDLAHLVACLRNPNQSTQIVPKQDGSLIILRGSSDFTLARWLAQSLRLCADKVDRKPLTISPTAPTVFAQLMQAEGLPVSGMTSVSEARPSLQVLKLAPCFLWQPFDVYKVMEFVNLPVQPLQEQLATLISEVLAEKPGFDSVLWFARVQDFLDKSEDPRVAETYRFLFKRRRYELDQTVPRREALELYQWLTEWASDMLTNDGDATYQVLVAQSARIVDLLDALSDDRLTFLELEHVIRTVFEPTPVQITPESMYPYQICTEPGAVIAPVDTLIWWNFTDTTTTPQSDFWSAAERAILVQNEVAPNLSTYQRLLERSLQTRPFYQAQNRVILCLPDKIGGEEAVPHPLYVQLETMFKPWQDIMYHTDNQVDTQRLSAHLALPAQTIYTIKPAEAPAPFLVADQDLPVFDDTKEESFSTLERLLYYPHQWFLSRQLLLWRARLLDIKSDHTLLGNLSHRFFEEILQHPNLSKFTKKDVADWLEKHAQKILEEEGATLLLYGREIELQQFLHTLRRGIQSFVQMLQNNGWKVDAVEQAYRGKVGDLPVHCRTDVILEKNGEKCILDLKWAGSGRRTNLVRNGEDIQLITYARALPPTAYWPHTGFYIISESKLIMRNREAFQEATIPGKLPEKTHAEIASEIFERLEKTLEWRLEQVRSGQIEVRTTDTFQALEDLYASDLPDLLNLPRESGKFDAYLTLVYGA